MESRFDDTLRKRLAGKWCVYCGELADTIEHFPPATFGREGYLLPCCSECNRLAGTDYPVNFSARSELVKERLSNCHKLPRLPDTVKSALELQDKDWSLFLEDLQTWRRLSQRLVWNAELYFGLIGGTSNSADSAAKTVSTIESEQKPRKTGMTKEEKRLLRKRLAEKARRERDKVMPNADTFVKPLTPFWEQ